MICSDLDQKLCTCDHFTVGWLETDDRLGKLISRSTVSTWTNPIGLRPIGKRFKNFTLIAAIIAFVTTPDLFYFKFSRSLHSDIGAPNGHISMIIVNLGCKIDSG